jgi:regulator of protease activity HflC (stomatin/prohibitin superfamily)
MRTSGFAHLVRCAIYLTNQNQNPMKTSYIPSIPKIGPRGKSKVKLFSFLFIFFLFFQSCVTIRPGEIGIITQYGRMQSKTLTYGRHVSGIFGRHVIIMNTRVIEYSTKMDLPTKEGLEISADMTLLYHLKPEAAQQMYKTFGVNYGKTLVENNFIAVSREATLNYNATEIIDQRATLEKIMRAKLDSSISSYGIVIDALLLKDIDLPSEITASIEQKVKAEQDLKSTQLDIQKQRLQQQYAIEKDSLQTAATIKQQRAQEQFAVEKQKQEAERTIIEATAKKQSLDLVNAALSDKLIQYERVQVSKEFATSPNSKIIITDGKSDIHLGTPTDQ